MAPDSCRNGHQLGEATIGFQRRFLKTTLLVCLFLVLPYITAEASTELTKGSWGNFSKPFIIHERPSHGDTLNTSTLPLPAASVSASPVGQWSNKIEIEIPDHPAVYKHIRSYSKQDRMALQKALERRRSQVHTMTDILESHGVPVEMVYVVLVESHFKNHKSSQGPAGYWQLMAPTARSLGLKVDRGVDERLDPLKSTEAAAKYLRSLYEQFHSWPLALAAYNAGGGPVMNAIKQCGTHDFWEISRRGYLPKITRAYVPKVMAAIQIGRDLAAHDFNAPLYAQTGDSRSMSKKAPPTFGQVSRHTDMALDLLRDSNMSLRRDRFLPDIGVFLSLPSVIGGKLDMACEHQ